MKIASFNVNSIRQRLPLVLDWLTESEVDVLAIQETKVEDSLFPIHELEEAGYHVAIHGQKSYNGVATISRLPITNVRTGFDDPLFPNDCRILTCTIEDLEIINTYVPNGTKIGTDKFEYKLRWLERFRTMMLSMGSAPVVWLGDINIAPTPKDVYDSRRFYGGVGHHPEEFSRLRAITDLGLTDCFRKFNQEPGFYSYFDYFIVNSVATNRGWRIDHIYTSPELTEKCISCEIDMNPRKASKPSDHTPVWAEFDL